MSHKISHYHLKLFLCWEAFERVIVSLWMRRRVRRCAIVCVCVCNWVCVRACRWGCECECRCSECMKTRQNERLGCKKALKKRDSLISATFSPNNLGLKPPFFRGRVRSVTSSSASAVSRDVSAEMSRPKCFGRIVSGWIDSVRLVFLASFQDF